MTDASLDPGFRSAWPGTEPLRAWARRHPVPADLLLACGLLGLALVVGAQGSRQRPPRSSWSCSCWSRRWGSGGGSR